MAKSLTPKQWAFVKETVDNPTKDLGKRVLAAGYNAKNLHSAAEIGGHLMKEPKVLAALDKYSELFESAIAGVVADWKDSDIPRKREIALNAAMFGYDHIHGKATQRVDSVNTTVNISIDLSNSPAKEAVEGILVENS